MPFISRDELYTLRSAQAENMRREARERLEAVSTVSISTFNIAARERDFYRAALQDRQRAEKLRILEICNGDAIRAAEAMEFLNGKDSD